MTYYSMENLLNTSRRVIDEERLNEALITGIDFGYLPSAKRKFHRITMINDVMIITFHDDGSRMRLDISAGHINKLAVDLRTKGMTFVDISKILNTTPTNVGRIINKNKTKEKRANTKAKKRRN